MSTPIPRRRVGWIVTLIAVTVSLAIPLITARVEIHRLRCLTAELRAARLEIITHGHTQRQRINTLCEITAGQGQILAMNLPGTIYDWSPPIGELCR